MEAFFSDLLDGFLEPVFLGKVCKKFHYDKVQLPELRKVAGEMLPLICEEAFWERKEFFAQNGYGSGNSGMVYEEVVISLGEGLDELQEGYSQRELLSRSYMLEVLARELLLEGYSAYNRYIGEHTEWHVAKYHFPGSEDDFPLEMLPQLLIGLEGRVGCNAAFCMQPKKSTVFIAELTQDEKVRCQGICVGCGNMHCINRADDVFLARRLMADLPLNYGYRRILGKSFAGRT